jgi:transposase
MGAVRFCYNLLVAKFGVVGRGGVSLVDLRLVLKEAQQTSSWLADIPGEVKDVAVRDFDKARKAHFAKLKKKREKDPSSRLDAHFKFRSKRDAQQSVEVRPRDMVRKTGLFASLELSKLRASEPLPCDLEAAVRFVKDRSGNIYLVVPRQVPQKGENQAPMENIVSLDPGVRTFQTTYDTAGITTEWGKDDMAQLFTFCRRVDRMQREWQQKTGSKRRGAKRQWLRA